MKNSLWCLLWVFAAQSLFAQNYYREGVYTDGYDLKANNAITFEVTSSGVRLILNNVTNELLSKSLAWRDGRLVTPDEYDAMEVGDLDVASVKQAFRETFTEQEYNILKDGKDCIYLYMNINAEGRMTEVAFFITATPRTRAIPPEKYALLEKKLKEHLRYTLSEDEKKLQFLRLDVPIAFQYLGLYEKIAGGERPIIDSLQHLTTPQAVGFGTQPAKEPRER